MLDKFKTLIILGIVFYFIWNFVWGMFKISYLYFLELLFGPNECIVFISWSVLPLFIYGVLILFIANKLSYSKQTIMTALLAIILGLILIFFTYSPC